VITTPLTFAATAHQILLRGAVPVPVDIDRRTLNIDPNLVDAAVTPRTKALLPVHFAGRPCAMDALQDVAQQHDLKIVSDSAHAVEATYQDRKLAAWSDVSAYSFHPNKNMTTGEGGMVTTDHEGWAAEARLLRFHGIDKSGRPGGDIVRLGYKFNMSDLQAAIGLHQLQRLDEHYAVRREVFDIYQQAFDSSAHITPPAGFDDANRHALHMYNILLDVDGLSVTRDQFLEALSAENIGCGVHYTSLHRMTYYRERFDWPDERFPESSFVSDRILTLPLHAGMDDEDARDVTRAIRKLVDHYAKAS
jgi:dTDP-4-amino-4,6-dideoxygalactose transaminase